MPNHTRNVIRFEGPADKLNEIARLLAGEDGGSIYDPTTFEWVTVYTRYESSF